MAGGKGGGGQGATSGTGGDCEGVGSEVRLEDSASRGRGDTAERADCSGGGADDGGGDVDGEVDDELVLDDVGLDGIRALQELCARHEPGERPTFQTIVEVVGEVLARRGSARAREAGEANGRGGSGSGGSASGGSAGGGSAGGGSVSGGSVSGGSVSGGSVSGGSVSGGSVSGRSGVRATPHDPGHDDTQALLRTIREVAEAEAEAVEQVRILRARREGD